MATSVTPLIPRAVENRRRRVRRVAVVPSGRLAAPADAGRGGAAPAFDRDYWLGHAEGYRVDGPGGRLGYVEEVRRGGDHPRDTVLAVRAGGLVRRVLLVPAAEVAFVVPRAERIWLRSPGSIVGSEPRHEPTAC